MQANPGWRGDEAAVKDLRTGFQDTFFHLEDEAIVFGRPVLFIIGDTHTFRIDKPFVGAKSGDVIENVMRLEVPGSSDVHWVRVHVDPTRRNLFSFTHEDVVENYAPQQRP